MKRKVFTIALALFAAASTWAYDFKSGDLFYDITDEAARTVEVTEENYSSNNYSSLPGAVTIPETVSYNGTTYSVTSIGRSAFHDCSALTQVTIGNSVTSIGNYAFRGCSALTQVTIGNSVTSIGNSAFSGCSALTQITIPKSVESIGGDAFEGTALYNNADNWTNNVLYIDNCLIKAKEELSGSYEIATGTRVIAGSAFHNCSALTQITIPNSVTSIGSDAFYYCSALMQVTIPGSVTSIGDGAFNYCSALAEITVLPTVPPTITANTFSNINLQVKVNIPEGSRDAYMADEDWKWLLDLSAGELSGTCGDNLTWTFTTADSTLTISGTGDMYDYGYSDQPWYNFNQGIKNISLPDGMTSIGSHAFDGCSALTQITWNAINCVDFTNYKYSPFYDSRSNITTFTFGVQVEHIPAYLCDGMDKLTQVTIPENVESIGDDAFRGCSQLSVYKNHSATMVTPSILLNSPALDTLVCPAEELNVITDQELLLCSKQVKSIEVHSGTVTAAGFAYIKRQQNTLAILDMGTTENTELDNLALYDCYALEKLTLPAGLERIGYKGIAECRALQTIAIPASVTEIDDSAFENCRSISSISFGQESGQKSTRSTASSLKRIGNWAFYNCHQLQELAIPEGVTEIGNAAFYGCTYLENLELPASVQAIGDNCFALCSKLQAITVQATTPPTIAAKTFYDVNRDIPVYVPAEALEAYQNDTYWQEFNLHAMPATGLQTPSMPESIRVYGGLLHNPQGLHLSLYDMQGRIVYSGTAATVSQPAGVYVVLCAGASGKVLF